MSPARQIDGDRLAALGGSYGGESENMPWTYCGRELSLKLGMDRIHGQLAARTQRADQVQGVCVPRWVVRYVDISCR